MDYIEKRKVCKALQFDGENHEAIAKLTGEPRLAERMTKGMYAIVAADGTVSRMPASQFEREWEAPRQRAKPVVPDEGKPVAPQHPHATPAKPVRKAAKKAAKKTTAKKAGA